MQSARKSVQPSGGSTRPSASNYPSGPRSLRRTSRSNGTASKSSISAEPSTGGSTSSLGATTADRTLIESIVESTAYKTEEPALRIKSRISCASTALRQTSTSSRILRPLPPSRRTRLTETSNELLLNTIRRRRTLANLSPTKARVVDTLLKKEAKGCGTSDKNEVRLSENKRSKISKGSRIECRTVSKDASVQTLKRAYLILECPVCFNDLISDGSAASAPYAVSIGECGHCLCSVCCLSVYKTFGTCPICCKALDKKKFRKIYFS